ncbi:gamma-glutamyl-gamma-aminobutyrate hydrolase family protein [Acidocella sp. KAb 2-4]|uniref:gamma-glutamyl-gamma-aminobutyrate hydrolase family protein n=1 Tax=Acidocella sp. KAb 2-4 TaxID=2885158 RepID=UPI001D0849BB|nr:gamma-glutamyl-gamma-aminobutyrate hydrolase family protein [Acidocella sp. KAb 2-4]MCB5943785.1 gamma-glutamyl-gamma-aminobutyrate hydrolase family protein [Acidocella sp. KAb 2-4]
MKKRPLIGLTLDAEPAGGWSKYPWYALRQNYTEAVNSLGGLAVALPHDAALADAYLDRLDGLIVTGGAFDVDPALYGETERHQTVELKADRTTAEMAFLQGALRRDMPVLGICGGQQLLAVALGGTLFQHIPDAIADALEHEQKTSHYEPGHTVQITPGTRLYEIVGATMQVNTSHHQAVRAPGRSVVNAVAPDGVIEGIEDPARKFCIGVQWHPEYFVDPGDTALYQAFLAACHD